MNRRDLLQRSVAFATILNVGTAMSATTSQAAASTEQDAPVGDGRKDFDFFIGRWTVAAKRLRHRLSHDQVWEPVTGTTRVLRILNGAGNVDEDEFQLPGQVYIGGMLRLFDAKQNRWATYGLDRDSGALQPPLHGHFQANRGTFYGDDEEGGRSIKVRHLYVNSTPTTCRWEQAFSADEGKSWEVNWVIDFTRLESPPHA